MGCRSQQEVPYPLGVAGRLLPCLPWNMLRTQGWSQAQGRFLLTCALGKMPSAAFPVFTFDSSLVLILRVSLLTLHVPSSGWPFLPVRTEVGSSAFLGETPWRGVHRRHPPSSDYSSSPQSRSWDKGTVNCKITFFPQNPFPFFSRAFPQNFNE